MCAYRITMVFFVVVVLILISVADGILIDHFDNTPFTRYTSFFYVQGVYERCFNHLTTKGSTEERYNSKCCVSPQINGQHFVTDSYCPETYSLPKDWIFSRGKTSLLEVLMDERPKFTNVENLKNALENCKLISETFNCCAFPNYDVYDNKDPVFMYPGSSNNDGTCHEDYAYPGEMHHLRYWDVSGISGIENWGSCESLAFAPL